MRETLLFYFIHVYKMHVDVKKKMGTKCAIYSEHET